MSWRAFLAGYLTFSRRDRTGVLVLLFLIFVAAALPYFVPRKEEVPVAVDEPTQAALDSLERSAANKKNTPDDYRSYAFEPSETERYDPAAGELFYFDPNTLDDAGWRRLGLSGKSIRTINNYRSKGGRFRRPEDLAKIYSLPPHFYERVKDHIRMAQEEQRQYYGDAQPRKFFSKRAPAVIDVNTADTTAFISLPGIGSRLAARIVAYRNKLGGFYSVEQVGETYGVPDSTFQKIKQRLSLATPNVQQININTASKEMLSAHPYIDRKLANAIVAYREQHGPFTQVGDLKKIMILDEAIFEKLKPYLTL